MQTAQQICNSLHLPGIHTCNGVVDVLNSHCGIHEQPEVPASDVTKYGINVLVYHHQPLPKFPEKTRDGLKRYLNICPVQDGDAYNMGITPIDYITLMYPLNFIV